MARHRAKQPQGRRLNESLDDFASMIERSIVQGDVSQIGAGAPDDEYARVLRGVEHMQVAMDRLHRVLTTARMLREQLMGNREPEAAAYIIEDDIRLVIRRGDLSMAADTGEHG